MFIHTRVQVNYIVCMQEWIVHITCTYSTREQVKSMHVNSRVMFILRTSELQYMYCMHTKVNCAYSCTYKSTVHCQMHEYMHAKVMFIHTRVQVNYNICTEYARMNCAYTCTYKTTSEVHVQEYIVKYMNTVYVYKSNVYTYKSTRPQLHYAGLPVFIPDCLNPIRYENIGSYTAPLRLLLRSVPGRHYIL